MMIGPPSGFRDLDPDIMLIRKEIIKAIEDVYQRYGFEPIETPALEYWDLLKGKYGEEAERKLIYYFKDPWSEKWYALRYDLTVPLVRYLSTRSFPLPFKRYQIGRVWRHDRPQRARYREFWQADADIVGSPYPEADAEVLNLTIDAMRAIGFTTYKIVLNDRKLLEALIRKSVGGADILEIYRAVDKLDKIGEEGVRRELLSLGLSQPEAERILSLIKIKGSADEFFAKVSSILEDPKVLETLEEILDLIVDKSRIELSLSLVRGLDYYTGPIWEVKVLGAEFPSVGGGGRYDDLFRIISKKDLPATGTSLGIDRLVDAGLELGVFKGVKKQVADVAVVAISRQVYRYCWNLVYELRKEGIRAVIDLMRRKQRKQREYAEAKGIDILLFVGEKEISKGTVTIYQRSSGMREEVPKEQLVSKLKELVG